MNSLVKVRTAPGLMEHASLEWQIPVAMCALGVGSAAAGLPEPLSTVGYGLVGGSAVAMLAAWRKREQEQLALVVAGTLGPVIGRGPASSVRGRRWRGWSGRGAGRPAVLVIRYDPAADSASVDFTTRICDLVESRVGVAYRVHRHDPSRCRLVLKADPAALEAASTPDPWVADRARDIVRTFLGKDASFNLAWEGNRLQRVEVSHKIGVKISPNPLMRMRVENTVNQMLPGRWRARWDLEADTAVFELRPEIPSTLTRHTGEICDADLLRLPYAVDEDGHILCWDLASSAATPHFMTIGSTGTGKTNLIRTLITEGTRRGWCFRLCDPKRIEFAGFRGWPNVETVATAVPDIVAVIHQTWLEMERRYKLIEAGTASTEDFPRLVLVLDEYRYFYGVINDWYAEVKGTGGSKVCPILGEVFLIASLGRSAKVNIILGTQRPDAAWLGGDVRDQFMARSSLGRLSRDGAQMLWGSPAIGVSIPRGKAGRGTSVGVDGSPVECQSYWTPDPRSSDPADVELLEALRPSETRWAPYVVVPPPEVDDDGQPLESKGRWVEYRDAKYEPLEKHPHLALGSGQRDIAPPTGMSEREPIQEVAEEYLDPLETRETSVTPGQLLCIDQSSDLWGVVDDVSTDYVDESQVLISWRADDGSDFGLLSLDGDEVLTVRPQNEDVVGVVNDVLPDQERNG